MLTIYDAPLVFDGNNLYKDASVAVEDGLIVAIGDARSVHDAASDFLVVKVDGVITPGLANAHTHLEYTDFQVDVGETEPFSDWLLAVSRARRHAEAANYDWGVGARRGLRQSLENGVTVVGDIVTYGAGLQARLDSPIRGRSYLEQVRVQAADTILAVSKSRQWLRSVPVDVEVGISPHAPYSVSRRALTRLGQLGAPLHVHLSESEAEVEWVLRGSGPILENHRHLGLQFELDGVGAGTSPVGYLDQLGLLSPTLLAAHGLYLNDGDRQLLKKSGATVVVCPRSNMRLHKTAPNISALMRSGVNFCFGTDSTLSSPDLAVLEDVRAAFNSTPGDREAVARSFLHAATVSGARALGVDVVLRPGGAADFVVWNSPGELLSLRQLLEAPGVRCAAVFIRGHQEVGEPRVPGVRRISGTDAWLPKTYGAKAQGLARLASSGVRVPPAVVIDIATLGQPHEGFWQEIWRDELMSLGSRLAVRSSFADEDLVDSSAAGKFESVLNVPNSCEEIRAAVDRVVASSDKRAGSVIVQRYVDFSYSGVAFTSDPDAGGNSTVEWSESSQEVTNGGDGDVQAVTFRRDAPEVPVELSALAAEMGRLHTLHPFGSDLEWGVEDDGTLHFLQCRPITRPSRLWGTTIWLDARNALVSAVDAAGNCSYTVLEHDIASYSSEGSALNPARCHHSSRNSRDRRQFWSADVHRRFTTESHGKVEQSSPAGTRIICRGRAEGRAFVESSLSDIGTFGARVAELAKAYKTSDLILVADSPDLRYRDHIRLFRACIFYGGAALGHLSIILRESDIPSVIIPARTILPGNKVELIDGRVEVVG